MDIFNTISAMSGMEIMAHIINIGLVLAACCMLLSLLCSIIVSMLDDYGYLQYIADRYNTVLHQRYRMGYNMDFRGREYYFVYLLHENNKVRVSIRHRFRIVKYKTQEECLVALSKHRGEHD